MTPGLSVVLAHQGGWDELLFVLLPITLFAGLLAIANRRANQAQAALDRETAEPGEPGEPGEPD